MFNIIETRMYSKTKNKHGKILTVMRKKTAMTEDPIVNLKHNRMP
jgi:hypothetical protein